jgi:hypothetical protein
MLSEITDNFICHNKMDEKEVLNKCLCNECCSDGGKAKKVCKSIYKELKKREGNFIGGVQVFQ